MSDVEEFKDHDQEFLSGGASPSKRIGRGVALFETKSAPWLSRISVPAMIEFKRMYERYARELQIASPPGSDPVVPYKMVDCVDEKLLSTICRFGGFPNTDEEPAPTMKTITDEHLLHFINTEIALPYTVQTSIVSLEDLAKNI